VTREETETYGWACSGEVDLSVREAALAAAIGCVGDATRAASTAAPRSVRAYSDLLTCHSLRVHTNVPQIAFQRSSFSLALRNLG
jgi:hypothetical protein